MIYLLMACKGTICHGNHPQPTVKGMLIQLAYVLFMWTLSFCIVMIFVLTKKMLKKFKKGKKGDAYQ
jgi:apolipoprotein N-acyltransferase